jgi:hypothetical protein
MASPINTFTAFLFILTATLSTISLMYVHNLNNKIQNRPNSKSVNKTIDQPLDQIIDQPIGQTIGDSDRVQFISKCNMVNQELEHLLSNRLINVNDNHRQLLIEKKQYIKSIRDIVNDLTFNNRKHFQQLHGILKEIHRDVENQNKRIVVLEQRVSKGDRDKNELANMLIQRMVNDSSKKALKKSQIGTLLSTDGDREEELRMLEKYIIKTIRKTLKHEVKTNIQPVQTMNMNPGISNELERKLELMDLVNHKLRTMENLYRNLHSPNKKQIITVIKEPVQKSIQPYVAIPDVAIPDVATHNVDNHNVDNHNVLVKCPKKSNKSKKSKKHSLRVHKKENEANTYYVTDD